MHVILMILMFPFFMLGVYLIVQLYKLAKWIVLSILKGIKS
jgi:hypothetical protein